MRIENVISDENLQKRFDSLCEKNWKIKRMTKELSFDTAKDIIDNWFLASRQNLLRLLDIRENEDYKFVYHPK